MQLSRCCPGHGHETVLEWVIVLDTLDSLLRLCFISVFLMKESCPGPLTVDIDTDMSELHLEPVTISPYTRGRRGHQHQGLRGDGKAGARQQEGQRAGPARRPQWPPEQVVAPRHQGQAAAVLSQVNGEAAEHRNAVKDVLRQFHNTRRRSLLGR